VSIKSKVFAAVATAALVAGTGAAGALSASAATPSCGNSCVELFSHDFGTHHHPNFVLDVQQQAQQVGKPIILFRVSNSDPAEDWTIAYQGQVSDFYAAGMVSSAVNLHYGCNFNPNTGNCNSTVFPDDYAFEIQYAPFGVDSGLCAGVPGVPASGVKVSLQPCGVNAGTVWIVDQANASSLTPVINEYVPLIVGTDTNFSQPFVLTYPGSGYPTDTPRPQLFVANLTGFSNGSLGNPTGVNDNQLWGADFGILP